MDIRPICILMKMLKMEPEKRHRHLIRHWSMKKESIQNKLRRSAESVLLEQEQRDEEMDEEPSRSGSWQTFKTP